ncbi:aminotransferase class I/II-fold pyridoxal phosphate-dependent enzyme [Sphingomonas sp. MMS24-JH45]
MFVAPDGALTEGSFTSLFVERDGMLLTPAAGVGLLPGVLRGELIDRGRAVEARLTAADLAGGFLVGNAVRGLLPAILAYGPAPFIGPRAISEHERPLVQTSAALDRISPSPTLAITSRVLELKRAGVDVIGLGAGEPDFDTPEFVKEAAIKAIRDGQTKYTNVDGTAELKDAIVAKFACDNALTYTPQQISVNVGGKHTLVQRPRCDAGRRGRGDRARSLLGELP